jgi:hypothetical protein
MGTPDLPKLIFAMTNLALSTALANTLVILSEFHGREDSKWLDELEDRFMNDLKNCSAEGLSEKDEIVLMNGALALLKASMGDARERVNSAVKDD